MGQHRTPPLILPGSSRLFSSTYIHTGKSSYILELLYQGHSGTTLKTTQIFSRLELWVQSSRCRTVSVGSSQLVLRYLTEKAVCWVIFHFLWNTNSSDCSWVITYHKTGSISGLLDLIVNTSRRWWYFTVWKSELSTQVTLGLHCGSSSRRLGRRCNQDLSHKVWVCFCHNSYLLLPGHCHGSDCQLVAQRGTKSSTAFVTNEPFK